MKRAIRTSFTICKFPKKVSDEKTVFVETAKFAYIYYSVGVANIKKLQILKTICSRITFGEFEAQINNNQIDFLIKNIFPFEPWFLTKYSDRWKMQIIEHIGNWVNTTKSFIIPHKNLTNNMSAPHQQSDTWNLCAS